MSFSDLFPLSLVGVPVKHILVCLNSDKYLECIFHHSFILCFSDWIIPGPSSVVQGLQLHKSTAGGIGLIPGEGTKIPHATHCAPHHLPKTENKLRMDNFYVPIFRSTNYFFWHLRYCHESLWWIFHLFHVRIPELPFGSLSLFFNVSLFAVILIVELLSSCFPLIFKTCFPLVLKTTALKCFSGKFKIYAHSQRVSINCLPWTPSFTSCFLYPSWMLWISIIATLGSVLLHHLLTPAGSCCC